MVAVVTVDAKVAAARVAVAGPVVERAGTCGRVCREGVREEVERGSGAWGRAVAARGVVVAARGAAVAARGVGGGGEGSGGVGLGGGGEGKGRTGGGAGGLAGGREGAGKIFVLHRGACTCVNTICSSAESRSIRSPTIGATTGSSAAHSPWTST